MLESTSVRTFEKTSLDCAERLQHEYALGAELDADRAARPMAAAHQQPQGDYRRRAPFNRVTRS